jgi:hypothetical protein
MIQEKLKKRSKSSTLPLSNVELRSNIGSYKHLPYKALLDIISFTYIHKSPHSFSFYDRRKEWGYTENGTVRISDHWNYLSSRTGETIHSPTDISVEENTWIKACYCSKTKTYIVQEVYERIYCTKEEYQTMKNSIPVPPKEAFPQHIIEKRREVSILMTEGKVLYNNCIVKKLNKYRIDYLEGDIMKKLISEKRGQFTIDYPNFAIIIDGVSHTEDMLFKNYLL